LKDIEPHLSIQTAVLEDRLSNLSDVQKLRFAYELAATVSALHESDVLVKVISDHSVYGGGTFRQKYAEILKTQFNSHQYQLNSSSSDRFSQGERRQSRMLLYVASPLVIVFV